MGYVALHAITRIGMRKKPNYKIYTAFRVGKYFAVGGWVYGYWWAGQWYLRELKQVQIYDYMTKRARFYDHMSKTKRMWTYCANRANLIH